MYLINFNLPDLSQPDLPSLSGVSLLLSKGNLVHFFDLIAAVVEHKHPAGQGGFVYVDLEGRKAGGGAVLGGSTDAEEDYGHENAWQ